MQDLESRVLALAGPEGAAPSLPETYRLLPIPAARPAASVYQTIVTRLAQQAPLSKSLSVQNSPSSPLTLANVLVQWPSVPPDRQTESTRVESSTKA
jgi:hypothetical protein